VYHEEVTVRADPRGKEYYWIGGPGAPHEPLEGSDTEAVDGGFVSITPLLLDATDSNDLGLAAWVAGVEIRREGNS
jgi:5'-nucleotidase